MNAHSTLASYVSIILTNPTVPKPTKHPFVYLAEPPTTEVWLGLSFPCASPLLTVGLGALLYDGLEPIFVDCR